ncbi:hypothetical protein EDB81DRAFT_883742 [Dactylonectria macrodidyma]|uniref:Uncharacterized protein n=1 Tax=Dactylonectria macrodidyma TaxID=307937 RepID=A0A9P9ESS0_9HYPO|nr:hypothetical protein EDB81DRAFT_883742 [Dactylonectria macrodidyma]
MSESLGKKELRKVNLALEALVNQPQLLDQARTRFNKSPPEMPSPILVDPFADPRTEEERLREKRYAKLTVQQLASMPNSQFWDQVHEAELFDHHLQSAIDHAKSHGWKVPIDLKSYSAQLSVDNEIHQRAVDTIQKQWAERGIWKAEWKLVPGKLGVPFGDWHHGGSLELESEPEIDTESAHASRPGTKKRQANSSRPKSDEETQRIAERRVALEREHEASRPYHHFVYLVSEARERIRQLLKLRGAQDEDPVDINTKAYEYVKNRWIKKKLWIEKWGVMPGMTWMHEHSFDDLLADETLLQGPYEAENVSPSPPSRSSSAAVSIGAQESFHSVSQWEQSAHSTGGAK